VTVRDMVSAEQTSVPTEGLAEYLAELTVTPNA